MENISKQKLVSYQEFNKIIAEKEENEKEQYLHRFYEFVQQPDKQGTKSSKLKIDNFQEFADKLDKMSDPSLLEYKKNRKDKKSDKDDSDKSDSGDSDEECLDNGPEIIDPNSPEIQSRLVRLG